MKKSPEKRTWEVSRIKGTPARAARAGWPALTQPDSPGAIIREYNASGSW